MPVLSHVWLPALGGTVWYSRPWRPLKLHRNFHGLEYQTVPPVVRHR